MAAHLAYSAGLGALHGLARQKADGVPTALAGALFGLVVWRTGFEGLMPALGDDAGDGGGACYAELLPLGGARITSVRQGRPEVRMARRCPPSVQTTVSVVFAGGCAESVGGPPQPEVLRGAAALPP